MAAHEGVRDTPQDTTQIRRAADRVRITAKLIEVTDQTQL
jgi:hypothetical protein